MLKFRSILYPTDFSEPSGRAFPLACALARDHKADVLVLHVYPPPVAHGEVVARRQPNGFHDALWRQLQAFQAPGPAVCVRHRLAEGDAAEEIVRVAREEGCDLIVMGTHGRTGLRRLVMGSVAEEVLREARCPVLTVRALPSEEGTAPCGQPQDLAAV
jgi:nucleotide-binding universal stress UspA family protein